MKKSQLKRIIKEEIKSTLNEGAVVLISDWIDDNKKYGDTLKHWINLIQKYDQPEMVEETKNVFNKLVEAEESLERLNKAMVNFSDGRYKIPRSVNEAYEEYSWRYEINPKMGGFKPHIIKQKLEDLGAIVVSDKRKLQIMGNDLDIDSKVQNLLDRSRFDYKYYR